MNRAFSRKKGKQFQFNDIGKVKKRSIEKKTKFKRTKLEMTFGQRIMIKCLNQLLFNYLPYVTGVVYKI